MYGLEIFINGKAILKIHEISQKMEYFTNLFIFFPIKNFQKNSKSTNPIVKKKIFFQYVQKTFLRLKIQFMGYFRIYIQ